MRLSLSCTAIFRPESEITSFIHLLCRAHSVWGFVRRSLSSYRILLSKKLASVQRRGHLCSFGPLTSSSAVVLWATSIPKKDFSYLPRCYVEQDADIFCPSSLLSFFSLSSPLCLRHSSLSPLFLSSCPAPTSFSLSLFLCAHISVFPTRLPLCFSFSPCLVLILPPHSSSPGVLLGSVAVTKPTSSLDAVLALSLIRPFLLSLCAQSFPSLCHLLLLDTGASNVNLDGHKTCQTHITHTHALFTPTPALLIVLSAKLRDSFGNMT